MRTRSALFAAAFVAVLAQPALAYQCDALIRLIDQKMPEQKLSKEQLYQAILYPNEAILMGYETWVVRTKKGEVVAGLKTSDTPELVTIKDTNGMYHDIDTPDIDRKEMQKISLMPEGITGAMTMKELVDLVEYLSTLRNKA